MFEQTNIEKLTLNLKGQDLHEAFAELAEAGVSLEGFHVVEYDKTNKRLIIQKVDEKKVTRPDTLFRNNATPRHTFPFEQPKALPGEW